MISLSKRTCRIICCVLKFSAYETSERAFLMHVYWKHFKLEIQYRDYKTVLHGYVCATFTYLYI